MYKFTIIFNYTVNYNVILQPIHPQLSEQRDTLARYHVAFFQNNVRDNKKSGYLVCFLAYPHWLKC
jgi:hypothetical protein